jgi:hypothetical protein
MEEPSRTRLSPHVFVEAPGYISGASRTLLVMQERQ